MSHARGLYLAVAITLGAAGSAAAQPAAQAEALFSEGRALIKDGKLAEGCDKLEQSDQLDSSVGTLLNLGDCREKQGRLASAHAAFLRAEAMAMRAGTDGKRRVEAARRAKVLAPKLPSVVIAVPSPVPGLVVRRGAQVVEQAAWGTTLAVDAARYELSAEAPGHVAWRGEVVVEPGSRELRVEIPALALVVAAPLPAPAPALRDAPAESTRWTTLRKVSVGAAVIGIGLVGGGGYFGSRSASLEDDANAICPARACGDPEGLKLNSDAQDAALRANVLFIAGGAAIATGVVLWLAGGPSERAVVAPVVSDDRVGLAVGGSF